MKFEARFENKMDSWTRGYQREQRNRCRGAEVGRDLLDKERNTMFLFILCFWQSLRCASMVSQYLAGEDPPCLVNLGKGIGNIAWNLVPKKRPKFLLKFVHSSKV